MTLCQSRLLPTTAFRDRFANIPETLKMGPFLSQRWLLHRRHALRGLGVSLALPLLDCMRPLGAAETKSRPKRSVFIYLPNGVNTLDFQITASGPGYQLSKSLAPLERHRGSFTPISGLHHPHGLGNHHGCSSIWLTGAKIGQSERNTISVDQLMAQVTAPLTRYSSIEMSNQGHSLSYNADGVGLPAQGNPGVVFREMFTDPQGGIAKQRRGLQRRGSILDTVLDEANASAANLDKPTGGDWSSILRRFGKWRSAPNAPTNGSTRRVPKSMRAPSRG